MEKLSDEFRRRWDVSIEGQILVFLLWANLGLFCCLFSSFSQYNENYCAIDCEWKTENGVFGLEPGTAGRKALSYGGPQDRYFFNSKSCPIIFIRQEGTHFNDVVAFVNRKY